MLALIAALSLLTSAPSSSEVKAVFDHFYTGDQIVIAEIKLCRDVERKDKKRLYDCNETYQGQAAVGDRVYVYMTALVPRLTSHELTIQALCNGAVRTTKDMAFKGPRGILRMRRFTGFTVSKPGDWSFVIRDGNNLLKDARLNVE